MDESTFGLLPVLRKCWMKKGLQKRIATPGQQQWHHVFAAYNYRTDEVIYHTATTKDSEAFIAFLEQLMQAISSGRPIVLVLDNASYHRSRDTCAAFACFEHRLLPVFLPPYCSDLNPIERFWRFLKEQACANRLFPSMDALKHSVRTWLDKQNDPLDSDRFLISKPFP